MIEPEDDRRITGQQNIAFHSEPHFVFCSGEYHILSENAASVKDNH